LILPQKTVVKAMSPLTIATLMSRKVGRIVSYSLRSTFLQHVLPRSLPFNIRSESLALNPSIYVRILVYIHTNNIMHMFERLKKNVFETKRCYVSHCIMHYVSQRSSKVHKSEAYLTTLVRIWSYRLSA